MDSRPRRLRSHSNQAAATAVPPNINGRIDYNLSERHKVFGRWYWNHRLADEYDWTYETKRGLHTNGLTRIKTKAASGEWKDEKMSGSIGNVVSARELVDKYGPELVRYFLLSTHYRRPVIQSVLLHFRH